MADKTGKGKGPDVTTASTAMPPPTIPTGTSPKASTNNTPDTATTVPAAPAPRMDTNRPTSSTTTAQPAAKEKRRPVFLPMALGGLVAGLMGYGIAWTQFGAASPFASGGVIAADTGTDVQDQIDQLRADVQALPTDDSGAFDPSEIEQQITDLQSGLADVQDQITNLPTPADPIIGEDAQNAAVQNLSQQIADQTAALQAQRDELQAELDQIRTQAETIQSTALENARTETSKAAVARVLGALESGAPMTAALNDLEDAMQEPAPQPLQDVAADGVPTMETLRESFPDSSRVALESARSSGDSGEQAGGFGSFLKSQLNVRSTAPREGGSVDAILSRAEDALRNGRLNDALAELETLPQTARAAMSDWIATAESRSAAVDAAQQLDTNLTVN